MFLALVDGLRSFSPDLDEQNFKHQSESQQGTISFFLTTTAKTENNIVNKMACGWLDTRTQWGCLIVAVIAVSWVAASQFAASSFSSNFDAPLFNVWFSTAFLVVCFPVCALALRVWKITFGGQHRSARAHTNTVEADEEDDYRQPLLSGADIGIDENLLFNPEWSFWKYFKHLYVVHLHNLTTLNTATTTTTTTTTTTSTTSRKSAGAAAAAGFGYGSVDTTLTSLHLRALWRVLLLLVLWVLANFMYTMALGKISAADVTALFSSCSAFVFILSVVLLAEPVSMVRILSVGLSIGGIVLMSVTDHTDGGNVTGCVLAILSALSAALYKVLLKRLLGDPSATTISLLLSCIALSNLILVTPIVLAFAFAGVEHVVWSEVPWAFLSFSALLSLVFNFAVNFGVAYCNPLFISIGMLIGIPLNAVADRVFHGTNFEGMKILASALICLGFLVMLLPPSVSNWFPGRRSRG